MKKIQVVQLPLSLQKDSHISTQVTLLTRLQKHTTELNS